jgi:PPM family protein phosphatase
MTQLIYLQSVGLTDIGMVRRTNEDAFGIAHEAGIFVVCDGMGGAAGGEIASHLAVEVATEKLCGSGGDDLRAAMEGAISAANRQVYSRASADSSLHGMGTTLVAAIVQRTCAMIAHVGDSRCYLFRAGELTRQTKDHSLVDEQVRMGQLTEDEAERSPLRNVITRAIGTQRSVSPEITELLLEPGDILLLCSDGLTRELSDERIAQVIAEDGSLETTCRSLIEAAKQAGGRDNITCVLAKVTLGEEPLPEFS